MTAFAANLADKWWRLNSLYQIKTEGSGQGQRFRMRDEQRELLESLHANPHVPHYVIKARRLGLSTGIAVDMQDEVKWRAGATGRVIERNALEATDKMETMLQFAHDSMPPELLERFAVLKRSGRQFTVQIHGMEASTLKASITGRGGDCGYLWVSEGQIIAADGRKGAKRFEEIRTGAWEGARMGKRVVETTWMAGQGGGLWEMIQPILEKDPAAVGKVFFFPWHGDSQCQNFDGGMVTKEVEDYFRTLEGRLGKRFSREQKRWYTTTRASQGIFMKREYPSTLDEAFTAPVEGAIYAGEILVAETSGRVGHFPVDGRSLVWTTWDCGGATMRVWYWQVVENKIRLIDADMEMPVDFTYAQRTARMIAKGYNFGGHFLPHDGATKHGGVSLQSELTAHGLKNVQVIPRTADVWLGVNAVLELFPSFQFCLPATQKALDALKAYRVDKNTKEIVHDWSSHVADALRTLGEAYLAGRFKLTNAPEHAQELARKHRDEGGRRRKVSIRECG